VTKKEQVTAPLPLPPLLLDTLKKGMKLVVPYRFGGDEGEDEDEGGNLGC